MIWWEQGKHLNLKLIPNIADELREVSNSFKMQKQFRVQDLILCIENPFQDMSIKLDSLSAMFSGSKVGKDKNITLHRMPADVPGSINANTISELTFSIPSGKHISSLIFINTNKRILTSKEKKNKTKIYFTVWLC